MTRPSENLCPECGEVVAGWDLNDTITNRVCLECNPSKINARPTYPPVETPKYIPTTEEDLAHIDAVAALSDEDFDFYCKKGYVPGKRVGWKACKHY